MTTTTVGPPTFLSAVLGATEDPFRLIHGDDTTDVTQFAEANAIIAGAAAAYLSPVTSTGMVPFLYSFTENAQREQWRDDVLSPTAVLFKDDALICVYALDTAVDRQTADPVAEAMNGFLDDPIPLPGAWELVHLDETTFHPIAVLADLWSIEAPAAVERPAPDTASHGRYKDATIRTVFDFEDPRLTQPVVITGAKNRQSTNWKPSETTLGGVIDTFCRHNVADEKDGPAVVLGQMPAGRRLLERVEVMHFVGLDIDTGFDGDALARAILDSGLMAVMASTHSHRKTRTIESYSSIATWLVEEGKASDIDSAVVDRDAVRAYMSNKGDHGVDPAVIETMEIQITGDGDDRNVVISHAPMQKWRVIFPLSAPYVIADHETDETTGQDAWRNVPRALARRLGGLPLDRACLGVSRLWYLPAHPPGRDDWRIDLFGGDLVDVDQLLADWHVEEEFVPSGVARGGRGDPSKAQEGAFDMRWAARHGDGFDIADLLADKFKPNKAGRTKDYRLRGWTGASRVFTHADGTTEKRRKNLTIQCPFEAGHSNSTEKDDQGCYVANAGDGRGAGFVIKCMHAACNKRHKLDYLNKMVADGTITADDVARYDTLDHEAMAADRAAEDNAEVEAALAEYAGVARPTQTVRTRKGSVAIKGVMEGLEEFDPERRIFEGPSAAQDAIVAMGKVASVLTQGGKTKIALRTRNGLVFNSKGDAMTRFESYRAFIEEEDAKGKPKTKVVPALKLLLESDQVKIYDGIDCDPTGSQPDYILNTWEGFSVEPAPGDCSLLLKHVEQSVCAGHAENFKTLMQWFAHAVQRPSQKPGFSPVVIGAKGSGKSTVADFMRIAIGEKHSVKLSHGKHLTGNFNAHLGGKLFVHCEEVTYGGDKKGEGPLKDAITAKTMLIEPKGWDAFEVKNFGRFFMVANPGHAVPASDGERRWFVLEAVDLFAGKSHADPARVAYFDAIYDEADNGGIAAFLHYLLNLDISDFLPYAAPYTKALGEQARRSLDDADKWVLGVLETGRFDTRDGFLQGNEWKLDQDLEIDPAAVRTSFDSHVRFYGGSSGGAGACKAVLERHGLVERKRRTSGDRDWYYRLGPRSEWRAHFSERFGIVLDDEEA